MKTITLSLPDPTYQTVLTQARSKGLAEGHYLTILVTEQIHKQDKDKSEQSSTLEHGPMAVTEVASNEIPLPDTVLQILALCEYVWKYNIVYTEAVQKVAKSLNVDETTVRDKCTRRISFPNQKVNTEMFLDMLSKREPLVEYLCRRFPKCAGEIARRFNKIIR